MATAKKPKWLEARAFLPPPKKRKHDAEVFEFVLESVFIPEDVEQYFALHGGEKSSGLRLVSFDEATDFALGLLGQLEPDAHVKAAQRLAPKHLESARKQKFSSATEYSCVWTLALGKPGHRVALDLDEGFVVEHRADGTAKKLAASFGEWLAGLSA